MITLERSLGQIAYELVGDEAGWLVSESERMPFWHELPDAGRESWERVALAFRRELAHPRRDTILQEPAFCQDEIPTQVDAPRPPTLRVPQLTAEELAAIG